MRNLEYLTLIYYFKCSIPYPHHAENPLTFRKISQDREYVYRKDILLPKAIWGMLLELRRKQPFGFES